MQVILKRCPVLTSPKNTFSVLQRAPFTKSKCVLVPLGSSAKEVSGLSSVNSASEEINPDSCPGKVMCSGGGKANPVL